MIEVYGRLGWLCRVRERVRERERERERDRKTVIDVTRPPKIPIGKRTETTFISMEARKTNNRGASKFTTTVDFVVHAHCF